MNPDEIQREIETFCNRMKEHVDSIRVVVTSNHECDTAFHSYGEGNWYAQRGSVQEWLKGADNCDLADKIGSSFSTGEKD